MIPIEHFLYISGALFCIGLTVVLVKKNAIVVLMGIELMLNAANLNLVAFSQYDAQLIQGQMFSLFVIVIAAAEAAVGLAIILKVYHFFQSADLDDIKELKG
ncbi:NADH-quinone oxidoreductase subunit NuoK [Flexithrix dorotheae]|uniref:NADH-quinone oxidoreductase subunit NuoK n=1 Tax=Flexithrix dorotheae TaxID=70993 RepID=UPI0003A3A2E4|nr:NADH-quinone oxidoreductase subunit NuoK [Flexithrix dorotheae]